MGGYAGVANKQVSCLRTLCVTPHNTLNEALLNRPNCSADNVSRFSDNSELARQLPLMTLLEDSNSIVAHKSRLKTR